MISQFFVLSQRGDNIVFRDYRGEVQKGSAEIFFRKVKFWKDDGEEEAPPVFNVDGVNYFHVKVVGLLFVATTRVNVSPSLVLELLQRIARVIKDYLGVLNEDSLRKNFVLVYELLDEVIDFGYVQTTSTEVLKSYVFNEPIVVDAARLQPLSPAAIFMQGTKRMPGTAVTKSVVANEPGGRKREEIFVDIIEKISVTFSSSGYILTSEIDGTIQMKSYLTGNPEIRLALNDDLLIGKGGRSIYDYRSSTGSGAVVLDDCNFHESVRLDSFDVDRTLSLVPPDGEFPVMNYRMTQEFKPPFRINTLVEEAGALKVTFVFVYGIFRKQADMTQAEVIIKISAEFSASITANTIVVEMPLPKYTTRDHGSFFVVADGESTQIVGGSEHTLRAKLTFSQESHGNITKEVGPVNMTFTIPMYNASKLQTSSFKPLNDPEMASHLNSSNLFALLLAALLFISRNGVAGSRQLLEKTEPEIPEFPKPNIPEFPKPEFPPLPTIPTFPKPELPPFPFIPNLPKPEFPFVPHAPALQKPGVPKRPESPHSASSP
ncbi:AP-4 complex subunit mu [Citrus sinensis]|uniref:AP-4 complex subunit mu n=1 Tax=Citrus sinensis TaxID=2711 RepID=A0ACB8KPC1_CITSI|nr:AP-4 complex subunit mu [Citrus sinensis]